MRNYEKYLFRVNNFLFSLATRRLSRDLFYCQPAKHASLQYSLVGVSIPTRLSDIVTYQYLSVVQTESAMTVKFLSQNYAKAAAIKDESRFLEPTASDFLKTRNNSVLFYTCLCADPHRT